jgi:uncharacterized membrane protein
VFNTNNIFWFYFGRAAAFFCYALHILAQAAARLYAVALCYAWLMGICTYINAQHKGYLLLSFTLAMGNFYSFILGSTVT